MKYFPIAFFITLFFLATPVHAESALQLSYKENVAIRDWGDIKAVSENWNEIVSKNKDEEKKFTVVLYPERFVLHRDNIDTLYDFKEKKMVVLNNNDKTVLVSSLHALPIFRHQERLYRERMANTITTMIKTGKINQKQPQLDIVDFDMSLGSDLSTARNSAKVEQQTKDGKEIFSYKNRPLALYTSSDEEIPETLRNSYKKFLIYTLSVHPSIRNTIAANDNVFSSLSYQNRDVGEIQMHTLTLQESKVIEADFPKFPDEYKLIYINNPSLEAVIEKSIAGQAPTSESLVKDIEKYVDNKNYMDALLALNEFILMYPNQVEKNKDFLQKTFPVIFQDSQVAQTMQLIRKTPDTSEKLAESLKFMNAMKGRSLDRAYMLDLYMANHIRSVYGKKSSWSKDERDQLDNTIEMFITALQNNPWLAGAYADLGNSYFSDYQVFLAWICWEQAEKLNPDLPQIETIRSFRERAEKDFPEFF